jgi:type IX secretion system PorP/SprF family membrane protein
MLKKLTGLVIVLWMISPFQGEIYAQDYTFSQFYANPLYLNPAMAGTEYCPRIILNYRNQWASLPGNFVSYSASYDQHSEFLHGGLGIQVNYDKSGEAAIQQASINGIYAYQVMVSDAVTAQLSVQAGYWQSGLNRDDVILPSQVGDTTGSGSSLNGVANQVTTVDFATGFLVGLEEKYFIGGAVHHLTQPNISFIDGSENLLNMKITVHAGANFNQDKRGGRYSKQGLGISPNILYQQQGDFRHLNIGSYFTIDPFSAGIWYRYAFQNAEAMIISLGFQNQNLRMGYSYDYTVSRLSNASGGSHEISVAWIFDCDKKRKYGRAIKCPTF